VSAAQAGASVSAWQPTGITYVPGGDLYPRDFRAGAEKLLVGGPEELL
jgi:hypothetical protein